MAAKQPSAVRVAPDELLMDRPYGHWPGRHQNNVPEDNAEQAIERGAERFRPDQYERMRFIPV